MLRGELILTRLQRDEAEFEMNTQHHYSGYYLYEETTKTGHSLPNRYVPEIIGATSFDYDRLPAEDVILKNQLELHANLTNQKIIELERIQQALERIVRLNKQIVSHKVDSSHWYSHEIEEIYILVQQICNSFKDELVAIEHDYSIH